MSPHRILLVSPPWRLANWPSLALGLLKSYLHREGIEVDVLSLHLEVAVRVGWPRYQEIAGGWELGEALYFALYAPEEADCILARNARAMRASGQELHADWAGRPLLAEVEAATHEALAQVDLSRFDIVGFSVSALQLGASIYLGHWLKRRAPHLKIVFGGGSVLGEPGRRLLQVLPWLDAVVDGEGESALAALARCAAWDEAQLMAVPNLHYRRADGAIARSAASQTMRLNDAPPPDFDEFFAAARDAEVPVEYLILPVEASRGCQWEHRKGDGKLRGCTFCGLYRNSPDYRERQIDAVMAHIRHGVERWHALSLSFVDAYLPASYANELLRRLACGDLDVTLFCEMRCDLDEETASLLAAAGARHVQLGVEAFDSKLLAQMAKGVRMIDNVASIKACEQFGVPYQYNLITHFPGAQAQAVERMADLLPLLFAFKPPSLARFYLDRGSRIFANAQRYSIDPHSLDREPLPFLPSALANEMVTQVVPFEAAEDAVASRAWDAIGQQVATWRERHEQAQASGARQLLTWRDAGSALEVLDLRGDEPLLLELGGIARKVLLACDRLVRKDALCLRVPELDESTLCAVLAFLREHRLLIEEGAFVLSLPVRARLPNGTARPQAPEAWRRPKQMELLRV